MSLQTPVKQSAPKDIDTLSQLKLPMSPSRDPRVIENFLKKR